MTTTLDDVLVRTGLISIDELERARKVAERTGRHLADTLLDLQLVSEDALARAMSTVTGHPAVTPIPTPEPWLRRIIPASVAREYTVLPLALEGQKLRLAMLDPTSAAALDIARTTSHCELVPLVARRSEIRAQIDALYAEDVDLDATVFSPRARAPEVPAPSEPFAFGDQTIAHLQFQRLELDELEAKHEDTSPSNRVTTASGSAPPASPSSEDDRLARIEEQLRDLSRSVDQVRRQLDSIDKLLARVLSR